jgi:hypothetical protein
MVQKDKDEVRQSGAGRFKTFMVAALALLALASHAQVSAVNDLSGF